MTASVYNTNLAFHIGGEWVAGGARQTHVVSNPATGEALGELPLANAADLDNALDAVARGYRVWRATDPDARSAILAVAAQLLLERGERIATVATLEQGKPLAESRAEAVYAAKLAHYYAGEARRPQGRVLARSTGDRSLVIKEPVGPSVAFCPWNFPIVNPVRKLAAALAAGCAIIVKPAEETPASAIEIARCFIDAGVPVDVISLLFGLPDEVSRHLIASPIIRKISFTGSVPVGKHLLKLAADGLKRTTMELGGHAPVIVFDDCELEKTVAMISAFKFRNAGQVCVSPTRIHVQASIYERFVKLIAERAEGLVQGNGLDAETQIGPLANARRTDAIDAMVADARSVGGRVVAGGERGGAGAGGGFFYRPTVIADVPLDARLMNDEPFGPIASIRPFNDFDEAIEEANRLPFGLAAYCFTENGRRANLVGDALEAGMVGINSMALSAVDAPFGGVKASGHGSEDGPEGMDAFMVVKTIHQR